MSQGPEYRFGRDFKTWKLCVRRVRMVPRGAILFWILFTFVANAIIRSALLEVEAQYSSNPSDYEFGWLANGIHAADSIPVCAYCINAIGDPQELPHGGDPAKGFNWNRQVSMFSCIGVHGNEMWAYQKTTRSIVYSDLNHTLCMDAVYWNTSTPLRLRSCNSSAVSQQWTWKGNRLFSGLNDSKGEPLYLVGRYPDKHTAANQEQIYSFSLWIASSSPDSTRGFSFTSNFTFISSKDLIDPSTKTSLTTEGLLRIGNSFGNIVNGGFENSTLIESLPPDTITISEYNQQQPNYFPLCGWVVDYGPVEYIKAGLRPAEGSYSVHLNAYENDLGVLSKHSGSVSQTFSSEPDKDYILSFSMAGFPRNSDRNCSQGYEKALLQVTVNATTAAGLGAAPTIAGTTTNFSVNASTTNQPEWSPLNVSFRTSSNVTTVSFISLNFNDSCGPLIDDIKLTSLGPVAKSSSVRVILVASFGATIVALAMACTLAFVCARKYWSPEGEADFPGLYESEHARVFSWKEIQSATKNFSSANVLGEGGFGIVYKAEFQDSTVGAVKVEKPKGLNSSSKALALSEIAVLLRVHHQNLVNLTGYSINKGRHALVFEYLPNGSLYDRLHQSVDPAEMVKQSLFEEVLPWQKRLEIASSVAHALFYLHHQADPPVVHRDVKSRNIMLTATDSAKLADFGLSIVAPAGAVAFESVETMVRGSLGYLDPEYFQTGVFSPKSDVYSYGVVLLELISGHPAIYDMVSLVSWANPNMNDTLQYHELVDKRLNGAFSRDELQCLVELSKMCIQLDSKKRPNMREVVAFFVSRQLGGIGGESNDGMDNALSQRRFSIHKVDRAGFVLYGDESVSPFLA